jgi:DTW domain-containing protein YfiP
MHAAEIVLTTNTARLAARALTNSEVRIRGRRGQPLPASGWRRPGRQSLVLYPSGGATELNAEYLSRLARPVTLIVPDGTWRQARRIVLREPGLAGVPHVKLPPGQPSEYRLRAQPNNNGLCTFEAIARAIGILESREAQARLEAVFRVMVERTLWTRGRFTAEECLAAGVSPQAVYGRPGQEFAAGHGKGGGSN